VNDWRRDRIGSAHRGENLTVIARMPSGFAVIGDTQHLPGYSLLLTDDPANDHLSDLAWAARRDFLLDMALVGEAIEAVCGDRGLRRINYEVLGNSIPVLHAHVHPRYDWEPAEYVGGPVWRYPKDVRNDPRHAFAEERHGELRAALRAALEELMRRAGRTVFA
jgi:diadenosine tetraphosphate (Ap4A) HIT family hydrolase